MLFSDGAAGGTVVCRLPRSARLPASPWAARVDRRL